MNKWMINISNLTNEEVDFYNYTLNNVDLLLYSTLNEVAKDFGCGISFIYRYFEKIEVSGLKEYIYKIAFQLGFQDKNIKNDVVPKSSKDQKIFKLEKIGTKLLADYNINNELNYKMLRDQMSELFSFCEALRQERKIFGFGLGHAELAIRELFGMLSKFGIETFQHVKGENIENYFKEICENSVVIVYSFRGTHEYTTKFVEKLSKLKVKCSKILVTANKSTKFASLFDKVFLINNNTRNMDYLNKPVLLSAASSFMFFNDLTKNIYYLLNYKQISQNEDFQNELEGWRNI